MTYLKDSEQIQSSWSHKSCQVTAWLSQVRLWVMTRLDFSLSWLEWLNLMSHLLWPLNISDRKWPRIQFIVYSPKWHHDRSITSGKESESLFQGLKLVKPLIFCIWKAFRNTCNSHPNNSNPSQVSIISKLVVRSLSTKCQ